jgi:hypothetical protein
VLTFELPPESRTRLPDVALAVAVGLLVGAVTSGAQTVLGDSPFVAVANSVSPWVVSSFLIGSLIRTRATAAGLGVVSCVSEVAGYYLIAAARGFEVGVPHVEVWLVLAVVGGAVFGLAGQSWKWASHRERGLGAALLVAVCALEALYYALVLHYAGEAILFAVIAVVLWVLLGLRHRQHQQVLLWLLPAAGLGAVGGGLVVIALL